MEIATQPRIALQNEIQKYAAQGFFVVNQTDTTAQLRKPKEFNLLAAILLGVLLFIVGAVLYVFWYMAQKDELVYLSVDADGLVHATGNGVNYRTNPQLSWEARAATKSLNELEEDLVRAQRHNSLPQYTIWLEGKVAERRAESEQAV